MLISTKPDSKGKAAAIARSAHLTEFVWTPLLDIPVYTVPTGKTKLPAGEEVRGMIYSSTEPVDKFIGENVSFETFLSVVANPDSALYHKDLNGHSNSWAYFGIVCNGLVRYAMGIQRRYNTKQWSLIPGMRKIAEAQTFTVDQIELCDVLHAYNGQVNHVVLITDILRDETGKIVKVEASEAIRTSCVRRQFDVQTFYEKYKPYSLWRYDYIDDVPESDPAVDKLLFEQGIPKALPDIAVDYGNKSNYLADEKVVLSVFRDGENEVEICRGSEVVERLQFTGRAKFTRKFERGYYTAKLVNTGNAVEFCVTQPAFEYSVKDGILSLQADPNDLDSEIVYMEFRGEKKESKTVFREGVGTVTMHLDSRFAPLCTVEELTEEEKKTGVIKREIPENAHHFKMYFENKYGVWSHVIVRFR